MSRCPNCEASLADPPRKFCPDCGQETRVRAPTLGEFIQQFGGAYLSTEGALWRTLRLLVTRPGELTVQYLRGRRKHYVLPLRLYLTISVLVLLVLRLSSSLALHADGAVRIDEADKPVTVSIELGPGRLGFRDGRYFCEQLPQWLCERARRRVDVDRRGLQQTIVELGERLMAHLGAAMFLLLPAFALALELAYWNRGLRYTEHLVFALHVHAFWFLMLGVSLIGWDPATLAAWLAVPPYTLRAMRRVYGGAFGWRLLRGLAVGAVYLAVMLAALTLLSVFVLLA